MKLFRVLPLLLLPFVAMVGCDDTASSPSGAPSGQVGGVAFRLSTSVILRYQTEVDSLEIRLDNGTEQRVLRVGLASTASVNDLAAGVWKVDVSLTRDGLAKYQGSTAVVIKPGEIAQAQVVLKPAGGGVVIDIVVDSAGGNPAILVGTWELRSLPIEGLGSVGKDVEITLDSTGHGFGSDGCNMGPLGWSLNSSNQLTINQAKTKMYCLDSVTQSIERGMLFVGSGDPLIWSVDRFYTGGDWGMTLTRLSVRSSTTGALMATFTKVIPKRNDTLTPFVIPPSLLGTWYLKSLPSEGLESVATDIPLTFDSTGKVYGSDGCNGINSSWSVDAWGYLSIGTFFQTYMFCTDSATQTIERGVHQLASAPLVWSVDTGYSAAYRTLTLSNLYTGAVIATFNPYLGNVAILPAPAPILPLEPRILRPIIQVQTSSAKSDN